ncbi:hypothetical protein GCM10023085_65190 [Actinomadura viridis]|uniref:Uncharacterized ferritin-like protein (DUF455 family) n=1 Tax=Actinomadura viridis TaxID=58110 RepID=A0A931GNK6_9ACTN|nr:DUF455 family protein [Actinomadura viridis]MBG6093065.1 uncharacterized ferritin-like protein (DUF455 family) [Actinomadura viridis]
MVDTGNKVAVEEGRVALESLRFGCIRLMEIASSVLVRTMPTERKLELSKQIWALAQCADALGKRLPGLRSSEDAVASTPGYVAFTDAICSLQNPDLEYAALTHLAYPDLRDAVLTHRAQVPSAADELTVECLEQVLERLDAVPTERQERPACLGTLGDLLTGCGGVVGEDPGPPPDRRSALPEIPIRPGRDAALREAGPDEEASDGTRASFLHESIFRVELCAAEICAVLLAHHPEAPWGLRHDLAKQVRDEARHYELFAERMRELGVSEGRYPIVFDVWDKFVMGRTLPERLIIEQRIGEGIGLDGAVKAFRVLREEGDYKTLMIFDYVVADEITHVGNGNRWLRRLIGSDEGLERLDREVRERLAAHGRPVDNQKAINVNDRELAGFTDREIAELQRTWERERALAQAQKAGGQEAAKGA